MSKKTAAKPANVSQTIFHLLLISKLDTLYRDLYFQRAAELMDTLLNRTGYDSLKQKMASIGSIERQLRAAVERGDWERAQALTESIRTIKAAQAISAEGIRLGESVYDGLADIPIDPFSAGLNIFAGAAGRNLQESADKAIETLAILDRADSAYSKKGFYAGRRADFQALEVTAQTTQKEEKTKPAEPAKLQQEALIALDAGDLTQLDQVVKKLMAGTGAQETKQEFAEIERAEAVELGEDLLYSFSEATLAAAGRLGLAPAQTPARRNLAYLMRHGWQPHFLKEEGRQWSKEQVSRLSIPGGTGDHARDAIEFYLLNPFVTSGGTRYKPCLVVEDLLIEDFAEPERKQEIPGTHLLSALGFESRRGLSRIDVETALHQNGPRIVEEELGLDPLAFRLVAIPADIYTHLGADRGWGQQEIWTHFDGYQVKEDGKLHALAGGDIRFGGTNDVVSFHPSYTNDKIIARFAAVQRKRMMSWQRK
jgi:hypothetical protein